MPWLALDLSKVKSLILYLDLSYPSSSTTASVKSLTKVSDIVFDILAFIFLASSSNSLIIGSIGGGYGTFLKSSNYFLY